MNQVKLLDCTLRDGGYYTNWDFPESMVDNYLAAFERLPVDYIEIGYRSNPMKNYLGEYFYCPPHVLDHVRSMSSKKLAIILNEKDVRAEHVPDLLTPCVSFIDLVRIAVAPENFRRALGLAEAVKKLGFAVAFNVMYMSTWPDQKEFMGLIDRVDGVADFFYMVDSYGGVYPEDVRRIYDLVRQKTGVTIGFHGHNNLELGLINTLTAMECGAGIVDATVTGMGRGAGNLKMELLLTALNASKDLEVDFNALAAVVDEFSRMQQEYGWGTNLPYMVSGSNSLPQKDVMEWVTRRFYSVNSIIRALHNQRKGVEDNQRLPDFRPEKKYEQVIVVGGGPSAAQKANAVREFIARQEKVAIIHASSKNAAAYQDLHHIDQYFCLVGNEGRRMEKVFNDLQQFRGICVLPPYPRKMGTYIPSQVEDRTYELTEMAFTDKLKDTHTALAIQTALDLGAGSIYAVGYDGYSTGTMNQMERELYKENEYLFEKASPVISIQSLFPTAYSLPVKSIFSELL